MLYRRNPFRMEVNIYIRKNSRKSRHMSMCFIPISIKIITWVGSIALSYESNNIYFTINFILRTIWYNSSIITLFPQPFSSAKITVSTVLPSLPTKLNSMFLRMGCSMNCIFLTLYISNLLLKIYQSINGHIILIRVINNYTTIWQWFFLAYVTRAFKR